MDSQLKGIKSKSLAAVYRGKPKVDIDILLAEVLDVFGGPRMLALEMHRIYSDTTTRTSSHTKHKIMETIQRLIQFSTVHAQQNKLRVGDLTDEDLDDALLDLIEEAKRRNAFPAEGAEEVEGDPGAVARSSGSQHPKGEGVFREAEDL